MNDNWQVGDEVAIMSGNPEVPKRIAKIERLTKFHVVADRQKWKRKNGCLVGGNGYFPPRIVPATLEHIVEIEKGKIIRALSVAGWSSCSLEALKRIHEILEEERAKDNGLAREGSSQ